MSKASGVSLDDWLVAALVAAPFAGAFGIWVNALTWWPNAVITGADGGGPRVGNALGRRVSPRRRGRMTLGAILLAGALAVASYVLDKRRGAARPVPIRVKSRKNDAENQ